MPRMTKKYISWMLSALMCFSNSFTVIRAEEGTPAEDLTEEVQFSEDTPEPEQT